MRVLVVDDSQESRHLLERWFNKSGIETCTAENGVDALEKLADKQVDAIVSDILMPVMDGFQLCGRVKQHDEFKSIPFILFTGKFVDEQDEKLAVSLCADCFVRKSGSFGELVKKVKNLITKAKNGELVIKELQEHEPTELLNVYSERLVTKLAEKNAKLSAALEEKKKNELALAKSEGRYRSVFEAVTDSLLICDLEGNIVEANPEACAMYGYSYEELKQLNAVMLVHPGNRDMFYERVAHPIGQPFEAIDVRKDGSAFPAEIRGTEIEYDGKIHWLSIVRDISERKIAEEELRKSEGKYRDLVQSANSIILQFDTEGRVTFFNEYAEKFFGFTAKEIFGKNIVGTIVPNTDSAGRDLAVIMREIARFPERYRNNENENVKRTGERVWVSWTNQGISDEDGKITEILSVGNDITDRKLLEESLHHAQKMEAIGTLAGGIAHDFNNILSAILGYTELALMQVDQHHPLCSSLKNVHKAGCRARDLVAQIITFSRESDEERTPLRVEPIVEEAIKLLRASLPATIEIRSTVDTDKMTVMAGPAQIHQVLMNLFTNAAHAMQHDGGTLDVALTNVTIDEEGDSPLPDLTVGTYLKLIVRDSGSGIDPRVMERMFEPYFSTKERGQGTGLGLAVVHGIVKGLGGAITVESKDGHGSTFIVYIPVVEELPTVDDKEPTGIPSGTGRILFVDDEQPIVNMEKIILEGLGYTVTPTSSSIEALDLFSSQPETFDLVITDYTMPHMTGGELTKELLRIRPDIPIILCTGFSKDVDENKAMSLGVQAYIQKPIIVKDLAIAIRNILDEK